jgi:hypothetical protein
VTSVAIALAMLWQVHVNAQNQPGRIELAAGFGILGGATLGDDDADLRTRTGIFALFSAESRLSATRELELRAGIALTPRYALEVRGGLSHPELRSSITGDVEGAPDVTLTERIDQYVVDASLIAMFEGLRIGPLVPYAAAGAGYLRQLHEGLTLIEQGTVYHLGGGVKHRFLSRASGVLKAAGVRGDARVYVFSGGIAFDDRPRPHVAASGSFFVLF